MLNKINEACEKMNQNLGIPVSLPKPKLGALRFATFCNLILGFSILAYGVLSVALWCTVLGVIVTLGGLISLKTISSNKEA